MKRKDLMGVCYETPDFATPSFTGSLKSNMKLTLSSSSSEGCGLDWGGEAPKIMPLPNLTVFTPTEIQKATRYFGRINHSNIVKLLGYCLENKEEPLLVYEFAQKGSLDKHLFGRGAVVHPLTWEAWVKIALGVTKVLAFLHSSEMKITYRDFKTSNILLDAVYNRPIHPSLVILGWRDLALRRVSHTSEHKLWELTVMPPREYIDTGCLYIVSEVYIYGVVLLEKLTGLRAIDKHRSKGKHNLVEWSKAYLYGRRKIINVVDPNLKGEYPITAAMQMAELVLLCLEPSPNATPA